MAKTRTHQDRMVKLDLASRLEMLEVVQTVLSHITEIAGFDDDSSHYISVAIRESVINAIKHGNQLDQDKRVAVSFLLNPSALEIQVQDEGQGFDPKSVPDPVAEENLLKADGRGVFFMKSFMDQVVYSFPSKGGTVVKMVKRLPEAS